jgi:type I restriction enzyme, S subunit
LNNQFLALRLNAEDFVTFANNQVSGERPRIDFEKLSRFPILLPPLAEQERIVAKLHAALSGVERAETATRRARERLQRYRVAVLQAAVTGKLTSEWREAQRKNEVPATETGEALLERILAARRTSWEEAELNRLRAAGKEPKTDKWRSRYPEPALPKTEGLPHLPAGWTWASLDQIGELNRGKSTHRPRNDARLYGGSYPFIQTGDIRRSNGTIREHTQTYSEFGLKQSRLWPAGTLCITIAANIAETGILS